MKCLICNSSNTQYIIFDKTWNIIECKNCLLAFTFPLPIQPEYENMDFHSCANQDETFNNHLIGYNELPYDWGKLIDIQISLILNNIPSRSKILEIGCGEGILLNELKKKDFNITGIEPSIYATARARRRNLNIIEGSFPMDNINESYNLVIMSQVLEHVNEIDQFICEIINIIPSGYLLLTQTNFKGLIPSVQKTHWYGWVPEQHFWHFTLTGLTRYLKKFGFKRIDHRYSSLVHPHNFLYKIASLKGSWQDQLTVLYKLGEVD